MLRNPTILLVSGYGHRGAAIGFTVVRYRQHRILGIEVNHAQSHQVFDHSFHSCLCRRHKFPDGPCCCYGGRDADGGIGNGQLSGLFWQRRHHAGLRYCVPSGINYRNFACTSCNTCTRLSRAFRADRQPYRPLKLSRSIPSQNQHSELISP